MYGKKRIVIQKNNQIVLAGGGSWFPVGFVLQYVGTHRAAVVKKLHSNMSPDDFEWVNAPIKKALKEIINKKFNWIKESNG